MQLRKCFPECDSTSRDPQSAKVLCAEKPAPQPFQLEKIVVQMDSWETSQLVTVAAAIILSERLGFNVAFANGISGKELYGAMAEGKCHLAFEAWFVTVRAPTLCLSSTCVSRASFALACELLCGWLCTIRCCLHRIA
jgi:hypothetical protein